MRQFKRFWLFGAAIFAGVSLAACGGRRAETPQPNPQATASPAVAETGVKLDLQDKNGQAIAVKPGDLIVIPLFAEKDSGYQWSFRSPLNGGLLTLKRHTVSDRDPRAGKNQVLSEWVLKIEKPELFVVRLDYENPARRKSSNPAKTFAVLIAADRALDAVPDVVLDAPAPDALAEGTLRVFGFVKLGVQALTYRISSDAGASIASGAIPLEKNRTNVVTFEKNLTFAKPAVPQGFFILTPDGASDRERKVPVVLNGKLETVRVFFGNRGLTQSDECAETFPVARVMPKGEGGAQAALQSLLNGPTAAERKDGYASSLPRGVKLNAVSVRNGVATADFSATLDRGVAGSCRVTAIRSEITQTLKQFPDVREVVISIGGRTEDILQP